MVQKLTRYLEDLMYDQYFMVTSFTLNTESWDLHLQQYDKNSNIIDLLLDNWIPIDDEIIELLLQEGWEFEADGKTLVLSLI